VGSLSSWQVMIIWLLAFWFLGHWLVPLGLECLGIGLEDLTARGQVRPSHFITSKHHVTLSYQTPTASSPNKAHRGTSSNECNLIMLCNWFHPHLSPMHRSNGNVGELKRYGVLMVVCLL
jgi:hypothetical protein